MCARLRMSIIVLGDLISSHTRTHTHLFRMPVCAFRCTFGELPPTDKRLMLVFPTSLIYHIGHECSPDGV